MLVPNHTFNIFMEAQRIGNLNGRRQVYNRPRVAKFGQKRIWVKVFVTKSIFE